MIMLFIMTIALSPHPSPAVGTAKQHQQRIMILTMIMLMTMTMALSPHPSPAVGTAKQNQQRIMIWTMIMLMIMTMALSRHPSSLTCRRHGENKSTTDYGFDYDYAYDYDDGPQPSALIPHLPSARRKKTNSGL